MTGDRIARIGDIAAQVVPYPLMTLKRADVLALVNIARAARDQWEKDETLIVTGEGFREARLAHGVLGEALGEEAAG